MTRIIEMVGDEPQNPLVFEGDKWAYYLNNITEVQPPEDMDDGQKHWRAEVVEVVPLSEYYARERQARDLGDAQTLTAAYELTLTMMAAGGE